MVEARVGPIPVSPQTGSGSPLSSVTPRNTGDMYVDTDTGQLYVAATGSANTDWKELPWF